MSADDDFEVVSRSKHASFAVSSSNHGRRYWMPNGLVSNCLLCKQAFSFTVRKHHCRQCGLIFCDSCSSKQLVLKDYSKKSPVRVCDTCYAQLTLQTRMQQRRAPVIGAAVAEGGGDGGVTTVGGDGHGPLMVTGPLLGRGGDLPSRASSVSVSSSGTASPTSQVGARRHSAFDPSSMVPVRFIGDSDGGGSHPYGAGAALLEMHHVRAVSGEEEVFVIDNVVLYVGDEDSIAATTARVDPFSIETPDAYVRPIAQTLGFADKGGEALHENLVELEQTATQFLSPHPVQLACCGSLVATNFRVVFVPKLSPDSVGFPPVDVPLATIDKTEVLEFDSEDMRVAKLACKDFRTVYWAFPGQLEQQAFFQLSKFSEYLSYYMRPGSVEDLFAFKRLRSADEATVEVLQAAWKTYNFTLCMERLSIPDENWKIVNWNRSHNLCPTYPTQLTVPAVVSEAWLRDVSSFRSKARVPALTWRLPGTRTVLIRSAQPLVGLMGTRSLADEAYMDAVVAASDSPFLVIFDARPSVNAKAQTAMGAGYESPQYYETGAADSRVTREQLSQHPGLVRSTSGGDLVLSEGAKDVLEYMASQPGHVKRCILEFARIENIHVMRKSYRGVAKLCARTLEKGKVGDWWGQLNDTGWMQHLATIMSGAVRMASYLQHGVSVLCHCSDGWDRTAQLVSLAQVLLDPYFRTIEGFEVLVEKDWCAFGHKFLDRTGHVDHQQTGGGSNETSPVFSQFIDLVWQLQHQFPTAFEFGEGFLVHILDALYSCEYGNFITNNNRSHLRYTLAQRTYSLWQPSAATMPDSWRNPHYKPPLDMNKPAMLVPDVPRLTFWESYYLRWAKQMQSVAYSGASRRPSLASPSSGHYITGASMSAARSRRRGSVYPSAKESMNLLAASIESERRAQAVLACRAIVDGIVAKAAFVAATRNLERRLAQAEAGLAMATVQKGVAEHICYDVGFQKGKEHVLALHMNLAPQVEAESDDWMAVHEPHVHPTARIVHQAGLDASVRDGYADASSWVPDDAVSECQDCQRAFSFLVRKHHCRRCGRVFCNRCTTKNEQNKRVCLKCASG